MGQASTEHANAGDTKSAPSAAAHRLLGQAYEAAYRFPEGFGGFEATLYYAWDEECRAGKVEVRSPSDIRIAGNVEDPDGRLRGELSSIVGHRWPRAYEDADGRHRLHLDPREHPLGGLLKVEDDGMDSAYRVRGGHIQQIERRVGKRRFSINIQERTHTHDGRALPAHFCVNYWESDGGAKDERLVRTDIYRDSYIAVGGVYLPLCRRVITADDSGTGIWQVMLRDHRLLEANDSDRYTAAGNRVR